jgi:hypothetical protein
MRPLLLASALASVLASGLAGCATPQATQSPQAAQATAPEPPPKQFQMRTYYMAFLRRGPTWTADKR